MADTLDLDYETACDLDLTKVGLDRYTSHPSFRILMAAYSINSGRDYLWEAHRGDPPAELTEALADPEVEKWAWNMQFERVATLRGLGIDMGIKNTRCTMALAYMQSFAGRLEDVGQQVGLPFERQKLQTGKKLIKLFTQPQKISKANPHLWRDWRTDPVEWEEFGDYCLQDNDSEKGIKSRLIKYPIPASEWELYELDQEINDLGLPIDLEFVRHGLAMAKRRKAELISEMEELTGISNGNSPKQLTDWLKARDYPFNDINKDTITKVVGENSDHEGKYAGDYIDEYVFDVLKKRQDAGKTSYTKWEKLLQTVGDDGMLRYTFQFAGAGRTSRWAGRGFQPHNLVRTPKELEPLLEELTDAIRADDYETVKFMCAEPMTALTGMMRSSIAVKKPKQLRVRDLSSIETCVTTWLSGCRRLMKVYEDKKDPYIDFGSMFYKKPYEEVTKAERQISKPPVLGCTYRLGGGELKEGKRTGLWGYAESMGVDFTHEESKRAVEVFRESYPEIPQLWYALENAAIEALRKKGKAVRPYIKIHGERRPVPVVFEYVKPYLLIRLPSTRCLFYHLPRLKTEQRERRDGSGTYDKIVISYMGRKTNGRTWTRVETHGGKFTENIVQAIARDILKVGLLRAKRAGFKIPGHVHDEIITVTRIGDNRLTGQYLGELMTRPIKWCPGLPLGAAGWEGLFYKKD